MDWIFSFFSGAVTSKVPPTDEEILNAAKNCPDRSLWPNSVVEKLQLKFLVTPEKIQSVLERDFPDFAQSRVLAKRNYEETEDRVENVNPKKPRRQLQLNDPEEIIMKILDCLKNCSSEEVLKGKRHVVVVGSTGSGKSTLINSMAGCELRKLTDEEADERQVSRQALCVKSVNEGGPLDEQTEIGSDFNRSCTRQYHPVDLGQMGLCLWDIPGFQDTQGPEVNIANAVNLSKLLNCAQARGLVIIVTIDAQSLESNRGSVVTKTIDILTQLFASSNQGQSVQDHLAGILFCVTKASKDMFSLATVREWIITAASQCRLDLSGARDRIVMYDPLHVNAQAVRRNNFIELLLEMSPISSAHGLFSPVINADEKLLIQSISSSIAEKIEAALNSDGQRQKPDFDSVIQYIDLFMSLTRISGGDIPALEEQLSRIRQTVISKIREWVDLLFTLKDTFSHENWEQIKFLLDSCLKEAGRVSDFLADECCVAEFLSTASKAIRDAESVHQVHAARDLQQEFTEALRKLEAPLLQWCVQNSASLWGYSLHGKTAYDALLRFQFKETKKLVDALRAGETHVSELESHYIFGDQHRFNEELRGWHLSALSTLASALVKVLLEALVEELQTNATLLESQQAYGVENPQAQRLLCSQRITVRDVPFLKEFGFEAPFCDRMRVQLDIFKELCDLAGADLRITRIEERLNNTFGLIHDSAVSYMQRTKQDCKERTRQKIEKIAAAGEFERDKFELKEAIHKLRFMEDQPDEVYSHVVGNLEQNINAAYGVHHMSTLISAKSYHELVSRYQTLKGLKSLLNDYVSINTKDIEGAVVAEISSLIEKAESEIKMDVESSRYLEFKELRSFVSVFDALVEVFPTIEGVKENLQTSAKKMLETMITRANNIVMELGKDGKTNADQGHIARLLIKSLGVATELTLVNHFRSTIRRKLLKGMTDHNRYMVGQSLVEYCTSGVEGVEEIARTIIDTIPEFKTFNIEIFNKKAGGVTFASALKMLRCEPSARDSINHPVLSQAYEAYKETYSEQISIIVGDIDRYSENAVRGKIDEMSKSLNPACLGKDPILFGNFLGYLGSLWTYLDAKGGTHHGLEAKYVKQPHATQILGIFRLLGVDKGLSNHLIQINTGEGKSIALGFSAAVLAKLGFHVDVVCYNRYLSSRDNQEFTELFHAMQVQDRVRYSDFPSLFSKILEAGEWLPNARKQFKCFLSKRAEDSVGSSNTASRRKRLIKQEKITIKSEAGEEGGHKAQGAGSKSVLLLDEVDVFFSQDFYARPYRPAEDIGEEESFLMLKHVWDHRGSLKSFESLCSRLQGLPCTKALKKRYPNLTDALLQQEFKRIFTCVRRFPAEGEPQLRGGERNYKFDSKKQCIGYEDPVSGVPDFTACYSYYTAFTYFYACEQHMLDEVHIRDKIRLRPVCGSLLYSALPTFYEYTLGMSGTLTCLTDEQNHLLREYGLTRKTFVPSTFAKQSLNAGRPAELTDTVVVRGSYDEYFTAVLDDVTRELQKGRATLIVFADMARLRRFAQEVKVRNPRLPQFRTPLQLHDGLDESERQSVITRAIRRFAVTLMTRSYGRGTDFVCRDEGLRMNGGVHVILTFFPDHESENVQILGRTCRQDDAGSARAILFEEDLAYLGASEIKKAALHPSRTWDDYLRTCRSTLEEETNRKVRAEHEETQELHKLTLRACECVQKRQWDDAADLYQQLNADLIVPNGGVAGEEAVGSVDVCFVMDCTGSMSSWIQACKDKVISIASHVKATVAEYGQTARIRMAFVAYRDYRNPVTLEYDSPGREVCEFTENIEKLKVFVECQSASGGGLAKVANRKDTDVIMQGGDGPEDICGGLKAAQELTWEASARYLFLIADAPCHGTRYHSQPDDFPNGDPTGLVLEEQLACMLRESDADDEGLGGSAGQGQRQGSGHRKSGPCGIRVTFVSVSPATEKMLEVVNAHCRATAGGREVAVVDLSACAADTQGIAVEFGKAVQEEITRDWVAHHC